MKWMHNLGKDYVPPVVVVTQLHKIAGTKVPTFVKGFFGGSRVICNPPPTDTDCDIVLHVGSVSKACTALVEAGWKLPDDTEKYVDEYEDFQTLRKGEYNIMLFETAEEYGAVLAATCIATHQNLLLKEQRYELFETARGWWR